MRESVEFFVLFISLLLLAVVAGAALSHYVGVQVCEVQGRSIYHSTPGLQIKTED